MNPLRYATFICLLLCAFLPACGGKKTKAKKKQPPTVADKILKKVKDVKAKVKKYGKRIEDLAK